MCHWQKESICHFHTWSAVSLLRLLTALNIRLLTLQRNDAVIHDAFSANKGVSYFFYQQNRFIFEKRHELPTNCTVGLCTFCVLVCVVWPHLANTMTFSSSINISKLTKRSHPLSASRCLWPLYYGLYRYVTPSKPFPIPFFSSFLLYGIFPML